ncbi:hypothetical protein BJF84_10545 [Rhodococcus sp. CUA-806]|nr:hypothetical protein BJF84_24800 [Rhodococcus sp. CUA-806]OLT36443.1 hypothetical protein BJF84_10545 [Rhodococcus sp. CUA-806]
MGTVEIIAVIGTTLGVVIATQQLYNRSSDWLFRDSRVEKVGEGLESLETMKKFSAQLRDLGQTDWADEFENDAHRTAMKPLAIYDDRRKHPAPFVAATAFVVSALTFVLAIVGTGLWPNVARVVALVGFGFLVASFAVWFWASASASKRRSAIVETRLENMRSVAGSPDAR